MLTSELAAADVGILGAGREGASAARFLRRLFPRKHLTVYAESGVSDEQRSRFDETLDRFIPGPFDARLLARHDVLVRSPGVSPYRPELQSARDAGVRFTSASSLWFSAHPGARTICITGTKGKSTTAALTAHLLRAAGARVQLAGNIGQPLLDCPDDAADWWVIELSSYQLADLEGFASIGVLLDLSDEHLDWHGGGEQYRRDKLRILGLLDGGPLVCDPSRPELRERLADHPDLHAFGQAGGFQVRDGALWVDGERQDEPLVAALRGRHNLGNLAAALTAVRLAGYELDRPLGALRDFTGLPHRQQVLGQSHGLSWINDSLATTPVATLAALEAFSAGGITLLVGGLDRGIDWGQAMLRLRDELLPHAMITLPDSGPGLAARMQEAGVEPPGGIHQAGDLVEAVALARRVSAPGGTVLLSPGAPSFPRFENYADRGRQFARLAGLEIEE